MRPQLLATTLALTALTTLVAASVGAEAARPEQANKMLLIGIDGGEWSVIEQLWAEGQLPALKSIADRGVTEKLGTEYGQSPVIWNTIATGQRPEVHGITGFTVATPEGDAPVSSTMRKVPALWNLASDAQYDVAALGWWGAWPAEPVNGVNITERCHTDLDDIAFPASLQADIRSNLDAIDEKFGARFPGTSNNAPEDRVLSWYAPQIAADAPDFMMLYLHGTDPNSHKYWKYYRPGDFAPGTVPEDEQRQYARKITKAYISVDKVIGQVLDKAGADETNVVVVSDHGFHALDTPIVKVPLDMDKLLEALGVDYAVNYGTAMNERHKRVRILVAGRDAKGKVAMGDREARVEELSARLSALTYTSGKPVFDVRPPAPRELERGADLTADVLSDGFSKTLMDGDRALEGMVEVSGGHTGHPPGLFLAAGPDIDPKGSAKGINIHDIAPTVAYGMGLPVPADSAGRAYLELFTADFQSRMPMRSVPSWGTRSAGSTTSSSEDEDMLESLRALGYIE